MRVGEVGNLFVGKPGECDLHQVNRITLTPASGFHNSLSDDFEHYFWLAHVVKCLEDSVKSFVHDGKCLGVKHPRRYEGTD
jgi:hypothetical protein